MFPDWLNGPATEALGKAMQPVDDIAVEIL
jgi:hypothetical protein